MCIQQKQGEKRRGGEQTAKHFSSNIKNYFEDEEVFQKITMKWTFLQVFDVFMTFYF